MALDTGHLYVLYGEEQVVKVQGARRIVSTYAPKRMETFALSQLGELNCEKLLSTGRLYHETDGDARQILLFSVGDLPYVERLIKAVKNIKGRRRPPL